MSSHSLSSVLQSYRLVSSHQKVNKYVARCFSTSQTLFLRNEFFNFFFLRNSVFTSLLQTRPKQINPKSNFQTAKSSRKKCLHSTSSICVNKSLENIQWFEICLMISIWKIIVSQIFTMISMSRNCVFKRKSYHKFFKLSMSLKIQIIFRDQTAE